MARQHHPTLYFPDGDVVLLAALPSSEDASNPSPTGSLLFRLHKQLLSCHSPVFRTMFAMPYPSGATSDQLYDGVRVVPMYDPPAALGAFITMLYKPYDIHFEPLHPDNPLLIAGPLRLAIKYQVEPLRARLVKYVADDWPTTLAAYDLRAAHIRTRRPYTAPEPASAIMFAREFGCAEILPAAFYRLAGESPKYAWQPDCAIGARWDVLDASSLLCLLRGRAALETVAMKWCRLYPLARAYLLRGRGGKCPGGVNEHGESFCSCLASAVVCAVFHDYLPCDPLGRLLSCGERRDALFINSVPNEVRDKELCAECAFDLGVWVKAERAEIWNNLPKMFGLVQPTEETETT